MNGHVCASSRCCVYFGGKGRTAQDTVQKDKEAMQFRLKPTRVRGHCSLYQDRRRSLPCTFTDESAEAPGDFSEGSKSLCSLDETVNVSI